RCRAHVDRSGVRDPLKVVHQGARVERLIARIPDRETNRNFFATLHGNLCLKPSRPAGVRTVVPLQKTGTVELRRARGAIRGGELRAAHYTDAVRCPARGARWIADIEERDVDAHGVFLAVKRDVSIDGTHRRGSDKSNELVIERRAHVFGELERIKFEVERV